MRNAKPQLLLPDQEEASSVSQVEAAAGTSTGYPEPPHSRADPELIGDIDLTEPTSPDIVELARSTDE